MESTALQTTQKAKVEKFREALLEELPSLAREYIDTARAEGTTQAYDRLMGTAIKVIEGLQVDSRKDQYANLPIIHFEIGPLSITTVVTPAPATVQGPETNALAAGGNVVDVEARMVPDNPVDLLPEHPEEHQATLAALNAAAGAMAWED